MLMAGALLRMVARAIYVCAQLAAPLSRRGKEKEKEKRKEELANKRAARNQSPGDAAAAHLSRSVYFHFIFIGLVFIYLPI